MACCLGTCCVEVCCTSVCKIGWGVCGEAAPYTAIAVGLALSITLFVVGILGTISMIKMEPAAYIGLISVGLIFFALCSISLCKRVCSSSEEKVS